MTISRRGGSSKQNKRALRNVAQHLEGLRRAMEKLPPGVCYLLHSTSTPNLSQLSSRAAMGEPSGQVGIHSVMERVKAFNSMLKELHHRCGKLLDSPPGERVNTAYREKLVAGCAADLLDRHGIKPTSGNDKYLSLFEQVAASLFELATGEESDLRNACREAVKSWETQDYFRSNFNDSGD